MTTGNDEDKFARLEAIQVRLAAAKVGRTRMSADGSWRIPPVLSRAQRTFVSYAFSDTEWLIAELEAFIGEGDAPDLLDETATAASVSSTDTPPAESPLKARASLKPRRSRQ